MKTILLQTIFLLSSFLSIAQFTVNVPPSTLNDSTFVVPFGMTDSMTLPSVHYHRFYVCDNAQLILKGMMSSSMVQVYLEGSAKVVLQDQYFYPTIYMKNGAFLDAENGNQMISVHRDSQFSYFLDTSNATFLYDSVYSSVNFTYLGWPGGSKPCSVVSSATDISTKDLGTIEATGNKVSYSFYDTQTTSLSIIDLTGKVIKKYDALLQQGSIRLNELTRGIYILKFCQNKKTQVIKMLVE